MKTKEEIQLQHDWERYKNRLREYWASAAEHYPCKHFDQTDEDYIRLTKKWYTDTYLSEPMSPGQEYANNH